MGAITKKEIVLLYPNPYGIGERRLSTIMNMPLSIMSLSAYLEKHGFPVRFIDTRAEDFRKYDYGNALFAGITTLTGGMIRNGLDIAGFIRRKQPELPIIWGGVHPSSLPAQTLESPLVDAVCVGEGEMVALDVARALLDGGDLQGIPGLLTESSELQKRPWMNLDDIPPLPYEKLMLDRYQDGFFEFPTSRGCPHRCIFCYNQAFNRDPGTGRPSYRAQSAEYVVEQLERVARTYPMQRAGFVEDNFFAKKSRVAKIAEGIVRKGLKFRWFTNGVASYFRAYDDDFLTLLRRSGCFRIDIGGESGSPMLLDRVSKGTIQEDIVNSAVKCARNGITPSYSFIIGWPDEDDDDLEMTLALIDRLNREVPTMWINGVCVITPFPGTTYLEEAVQRGVVPPDSLEGWSEHLFASGARTSIPWHDSAKRDRLMTIARLSKTDFLKGNHSRPHNGWLKNVAYRLMSIDAKLRWKMRFFRAPYEWKLLDWALRKRQKF